VSGLLAPVHSFGGEPAACCPPAGTRTGAAAGQPAPSTDRPACGCVRLLLPRLRGVLSVLQGGCPKADACWWVVV